MLKRTDTKTSLIERKGNNFSVHQMTSNFKVSPILKKSLISFSISFMTPLGALRREKKYRRQPIKNQKYERKYRVFPFSNFTSEFINYRIPKCERPMFAYKRKSNKSYRDSQHYTLNHPPAQTTSGCPYLSQSTRFQRFKLNPEQPKKSKITPQFFKLKGQKMNTWLSDSEFFLHMMQQFGVKA